MSKRIQVGNLSDSVDDRALAALFAQYGEVRWATVATHSDTGKNTGVGFVEMENDQEGNAAIAALSGREHEGRVLSVCWSRPAPKRANSGRKKSVPLRGRHEWQLNATIGPEAGGFGDRGGKDSRGD
jgi:RNA recognition motif-containing protein